MFNLCLENIFTEIPCILELTRKERHVIGFQDVVNSFLGLPQRLATFLDSKLAPEVSHSSSLIMILLSGLKVLLLKKEKLGCYFPQRGQHSALLQKNI